jgi:hypothetical protein
MMTQVHFILTYMCTPSDASIVLPAAAPLRRGRSLHHRYLKFSIRLARKACRKKFPGILEPVQVYACE